MGRSTQRVVGTNLEARVRAKSLRVLREFFAGHDDPMPKVNELDDGIPRYNDSSRHQGVTWRVARATHSQRCIITREYE